MTSGYAKIRIVENKTGAATRIGIEAVKNSPADGRVMLISPAGMMYVYPHIYEKLSYDYFGDFAPVSTVATTPAELGQIVKSEYDRWGPIVKAIGFKAE